MAFIASLSFNFKRNFLLAIILLLSSVHANAQIAGDLAAMRAIVAANYACSTFHCRTKAIEATEADTLYGFMLRLATASIGDLQSVTDINNVTDNDIYMVGGSVRVQDDLSSPTARATLSQRFLILQDFTAGSGGSYLRAISHSASHYDAYLPAEGSSSDPAASTLVLHTTKDPILVTTGGSDVAIHNKSVMSVNNGLFITNHTATAINNYSIGPLALNWQLGDDGGRPTLKLKDAGSFYGSIKTRSALTANRVWQMPDAAGTVALRNDTVGDGTTDNPVLVTKTYADANYGPGASQNISNANLTWTTNHQHNQKRYTTQFDSVLAFNILDTNSHTVLGIGINKVSVYHLGGSSGTPSIVAGTGAGTGPTISLSSNATDLAGYITLTTGSTPAALATAFTVTFATAYSTTPQVVLLLPANAAAVALNGTAGKQIYNDVAGTSTTTFTGSTASTALTAATTYIWRYVVIQ